jgi:hypothetical protein
MMDIKKQKQQRIDFIRKIYSVAFTEYSSSPTSVCFGLSKYRAYNFSTREFIENGVAREGYIIGESLGLTETEVDNIVVYFSANEVGYMSASLGLMQFSITQLGIMYVENFEEETILPIQINYNTTSVGNIYSPTQFQQGSINSPQSQTLSYTQKTVKDFFTLLQTAIKELPINQREDFEGEIKYAEKQLNKGNDISSQLLNVGKLMKDVGMNVFANVLASPIFEIVKPMIGL